MARTLKVAVVAVLLLTGGGAAYLHFSGELRAWRADHFLEEAKRFEREENWKDAVRTAGASAQLNDRIEARRILFHGLKQQGSPLILKAGAQFFSHPEANDEDRLDVLDLALANGDLLMVFGLLGRLDDEDLNRPEYALRRLRFHLATGQWSEALSIAEAGGQLHGASEFQFLLASGFARSGQPDLLEKASERLELLLESPRALDAIREIATAPPGWLDNQLRLRAIERAKEFPTLSPLDLLALAALQLDTQPHSRKSIIETTSRQYENLENRSMLTAWLARAAAWEKILDLTEDREQLDAESQRHRMTALFRLGQFGNLRAEIEKSVFPISPPRLYAAKAAIAIGDDEPVEAASYWKKAFEQADKDRSTNHYFALSSVASWTGEENHELEALARALEHPVGVPPNTSELQIDRLIQWLVKNNEIRRLRNICYRLLRREPGNPDLINNFHYFQALYDSLSDNTVEILKNLVDTFPEKVSYRSTYALALVRAKRPDDALAILDVLSDDPSSLDHPEKVVYCAALKALGKGNEARALAAGLDWTPFSRDEKQILQALVTGLD